MQPLSKTDLHCYETLDDAFYAECDSKKVPKDIKYLVDLAIKLKKEMGNISGALLSRKFKITIAKAQEIMKFVD